MGLIKRIRQGCQSSTVQDINDLIELTKTLRDHKRLQPKTEDLAHTLVVIFLQTKRLSKGFRTAIQRVVIAAENHLFLAEIVLQKLVCAFRNVVEGDDVLGRGARFAYEQAKYAVGYHFTSVSKAPLNVVNAVIAAGTMLFWCGGLVEKLGFHRRCIKRESPAAAFQEKYDEFVPVLDILLYLQDLGEQIEHRRWTDWLDLSGLVAFVARTDWNKRVVLPIERKHSVATHSRRYRRYSDEDCWY